MGKNHRPLFAGICVASVGAIAASNTARDGSGALVTIYTAGINGDRIDRITFISAQATAAASSSMVGRIFITDTAGANPQLYWETVLPTLTPSNTVIGQRQQLTIAGGLNLDAGQIIKATISVYAGVQDRYVCFAEGGNFTE